MNENYTCSICYLNAIESNENFFKLKCGHVFHFFCLKEFFNVSEFYYKRCCYCTNELDSDDKKLFQTYFNYLKNINIKCICSNLDNDFILDNKSLLNSNNYKLYKTCIIYNNYNNFKVLLPYLNIFNNVDTLNEFLYNCIKYESYEILSVLFLQYSNLINIDYIIDTAIELEKYRILHKFIEEFADKPLNHFKYVLLNSIIFNKSELFLYFKKYLNLFNLENINISFYFAIKHYNLIIIKILSYYCYNYDIKYNSIMKESCKKLNTSYLLLSLLI